MKFRTEVLALALIAALAALAAALGFAHQPVPNWFEPLAFALGGGALGLSPPKTSLPADVEHLLTLIGIRPQVSEPAGSSFTDMPVTIWGNPADYGPIATTTTAPPPPPGGHTIGG